MDDIAKENLNAMPYSIGQRVSLSVQHGDLPEGLIGEITSLEPPDQLWVEFKNAYDDPGSEDARVRVYITDIQPAARKKK